MNSTHTKSMFFCYFFWNTIWFKLLHLITKTTKNTIFNWSVHLHGNIWASTVDIVPNLSILEWKQQRLYKLPYLRHVRDYRAIVLSPLSCVHYFPVQYPPIIIHDTSRRSLAYWIDFGAAINSPNVYGWLLSRHIKMSPSARLSFFSNRQTDKRFKMYGKGVLSQHTCIFESGTTAGYIETAWDLSHIWELSQKVTRVSMVRIKLRFDLQKHHWRIGMWKYSKRG